MASAPIITEFLSKETTWPEWETIPAILLGSARQPFVADWAQGRYQMKTLFAALLIATASPAFAHPVRPAEDIARDAARHPAELAAFAGIGKGKIVADFIPGAGYFTRVFSAAVEPGGRVIAVVPEGASRLDPTAAKVIADLAADATYGNIGMASGLTPDGSFDVVWTAQNYHDLHNALPPEGVAGFNRLVFAALKPGGVFVVVDHSAAAGSGLTATKSLHRIDADTLKAEIVAAGFMFDGESKLLANPADDRSKMVFDPAIRGKTDQFAYRFKKP